MRWREVRRDRPYQKKKSSLLDSLRQDRCDNANPFTVACRWLYEKSRPDPSGLAPLLIYLPPGMPGASASGQGNFGEAGPLGESAGTYAFPSLLFLLPPRPTRPTYPRRPLSHICHHIHFSALCVLPLYRIAACLAARLLAGRSALTCSLWIPRSVPGSVLRATKRLCPRYWNVRTDSIFCTEMSLLTEYSYWLNIVLNVPTDWTEYLYAECSY